MKRRLKDLMKKNSGSTLVEIIVSVLIVGIAFVPLIGGMNTALKVNNESENEMYAKNVASNCMEIVKAAGSLSTVPSGFDTSSGITVTSSPNKYSVTGLKEGIYEYKAEITFSESSATLNSETNYKSIKKISGNRKVMVNLGTEADFAAMQHFQADLKDKTTGEKPVDMIKYIKSKEVELTIEIVDDADDDDDGKCRITPVVRYEMDNSVGGGADERFLSGNTFEYKLTPMANASVPESIILVTSPIHKIDKVNQTSTDVSDSLYKYMKAQDSTLPDTNSVRSMNSCTETVRINNKINTLTGVGDSQLHIYNIIADSDVTKTYSNKMNYVVTNASVKEHSLDIYSPLGINLTTGAGSGPVETIGSLMETPSADELAKIYDVKIEVYETLSGNLKAEMSSTIVAKQ